MAVAFIFITVHFYRAIRYGFHRGAAANSTFISVGPPGFTALALLKLGTYGRTILPLHTPLPQEAADIMYYASIPMAMCLLGLAMYCWVFAMLPWLFTFTKHIMYNPAGAWPLTFPCSKYKAFVRARHFSQDTFVSHSSFFCRVGCTASWYPRTRDFSLQGASTSKKRTTI